MSDLKVLDPSRFKFNPKKLLAAIAQVYLNLAPEGDFIRAVANDGRSYSKELFERFARTLKNRAIMTDAEVAGIVAFAQKVEDMKATIMIEDEREIPDDFLDPLMSTCEFVLNGLSSCFSNEGSSHSSSLACRHRQGDDTHCVAL
jgi:ubiquitin conjugation factor E4 B